MNRMIPKLVLLLVLLMSAFGMNANPVDLRTAKEVAVKFVNANAKAPLRGTDDLQLVTTYKTESNDAAFHIFNTPNGFVIVSADDCATPILGYSNEGRFDVENIPIQLQDYLQGFVEQIQYGIENHVGAKENVMREWELVRTTGLLTENRDDEMVEPLITAMWNQGCYYNAMCPEDDNGPCDHVYVGCVATAMGMIMHYWGYPEHGTGSHTYTPLGYPTQTVNFGATTYDWANMSNTLTQNSTQAEIDAVSTLLWHCGVAANMAYGPYESGTGIPASSLKNYFNYSDDMHLEHQQNNESWTSSLKTDLDLGRPVFCVGSNILGFSGHAFVCDGYDVNDKFHFNWGWGGSSNGYYTLNSINYYDMIAIINLHPNASVSYQVTASANPSDGGLVTGAGMYDIGSICTLTATANEDCTFMYWTENDEVVSTQAEYSFCVRKDRDLVAQFAPPFHIEVVSDPEEGGVVDGTGDYAYGSTCTLTATPNEGYDFICWRRPNGSVVTTAPTCSFTVTEMMTLTAVFAVSGGEQIAFADLNVKALCVANWDTNGDGELSYSEAAAVTDLRSVFFGKTTITSFEELQYFTGLTAIGYGAFWGCRNLSGSLYIPNSVTTIGNNAFYCCSGFTESLTIPNTLTSIGDYAFYNCSGFTGNLTIPDSVMEIGNYAFRNCSGFTGNLTIGNSVTVIGNGAFEDCSGFTGDLNIPNSVTTIGTYAFHNCSGFTGSLTIGDSVTTIDSHAFRNCSGFTGDLTIGNSVITIGYKAFEDCSGFTGGLTIGNSVATIGEDAFRNCSGFMGGLNIPNSVTTISAHAFRNCSGFTGNLNIPNSVTTIGSYAFLNCSGFTGGLTISNSVTTIGNGTFRNCSGFTGGLTIPGSVAMIGNDAFRDCSGFTGSLAISNSVTSIGNGAFSGCSGFTGSLTIPNSVTAIGSQAFYNCSGFAGSLTIGDSVISIGYNAFSGCSGFTGSLTIPNSVTAIGSQAFHNCSGFTGSLTIGDSVTSIGSNAFSFCSGFTGDLTIPSSVTEISDYTFNNCSGFTGNLTIGSFVVSIGNSAFNGCSSLTSLTVWVETPPNLGNTVFSNVNIEIPVNVPCGGIEAYTTANWGGFSNYVGMCAGEITVSANPAEGGTVTGSGYYEGGTICLLTATANEGYSFIGWTKDGERVSTDANYSFRVTGEASYVADFVQGVVISFTDDNVKALCVANWDFNGDGELDYNEAAAVTDLGTVFKDKSNITSFDELQYFTGLSTIGSQAFYCCRNLTTVKIPISVTSLGSSAFSGCSSLTTATIPNSVTSIGSSAFSGCSSLTTAIIPNFVTSIGSQAFYNCSSLTSVTIPNSVTIIRGFAFYNCVSLTSITIPNSVTSIGNYAFSNCRDLAQISVDSWNTVYDSREGCNAIIKTSTNELVTGCKNTVIPNSVTSIGVGAFCGCNDLTSIVIPNSVISIGSQAFSNCGSLASVAIANSVTSIGYEAFWLCSSLTSIVIPNSVTSIGSRAFYNCTNIESMTVFAETPPTLSSDVFYGVNKSIPVYVPCGSLSAYQNADGWNEFTNIQEICLQSQTITLSEGWNWFSTYIEMDPVELLEMLQEGLGDNGIQIESVVDGINMNAGGGVWVGDLMSIGLMNEHTYMIEVTGAVTVELQGPATHPEAHPITIYPGDWSWIGFPCAEEVDVNVALSGLEAEEGDMIETLYGEEGGMIFYLGGTWVGDFDTMIPGRGYMYFSNSDQEKTLVFQTGSKAKIVFPNGKHKE